MGKKHKNRHYNDNDILSSPPNQDHDELEGDDSALSPGDDSPGNVDAVAVPDDDGGTLTDVDTVPQNEPTKSKAKKHANVDVDLIRLEETMTEVMQKYPGKPDDWLFRTFKKNLHISKNCLRERLESHILEDMMKRVQNKLDNDYNEEVDADVDRSGRINTIQNGQRWRAERCG